LKTVYRTFYVSRIYPSSFYEDTALGLVFPSELLDLLGSETVPEVLLENGGVPLCNPASITKFLHDRQYQLKKTNHQVGELLTKFAVHW
jgi:hypothetical protein